MTTRDSPRTALIVHAHPEPLSFATAQMREAERALASRGCAVTVVDLREGGWDPVLARAQLPDAGERFKPQAEQMAAVRDGRLDPAVARQLDALLEADLLVLSFPLWWFSVPAILKGWLDRVLVMGAVFGGDHGLFDEAALVGRRAVLLVTTGGSPESFGPGSWFGDLDALLFPLHHGTLRFVGYDVLEPVVTYGPAHLDDAARDAALGEVRAAFDAIASRRILRLTT
ncbi:NAD(P)H-dependent oxidoreductase [Clavibacter nebraskensis]|uniref:Flavodoxin family protein n=2 Tax=Clavibacter nebraskensis TaxID=31963 RepID=A0A399PI33_9MICO|nr:NAD(P)H-dependent oxidoreductase [Clavibacter nebraskensis]KXU21675.1 NAD(P)H dehydrogenase [Clavibacter nebraskensis]OAH22526.1 NAD(P)H dehydrogenase [Clavibacter nebraskensis]QGV65818.1 NAD(P)H-dependent oxidoreductase [Clavibacter nebraskensis]QGV68613.1 NAD(P)H-dependent oxidoreductase [Clavibacter nebraskensis]QGV71404.1 NAD(P)H-dependent oxidoreductase [Clavibacter nebraskensis]